MQYFIDTNIFLRALFKENPRTFLDCVKLIKAIKENKLDAYTGTIVLAEVAYTLKSYYKFKKEKIIEVLQGIINIRGLKIIDDYNHLLALKLYEKFSVKYIDALISSSRGIQEKKTVIISYDQDFDKLGVIRKEPEEVTKEIVNNK